MMTDLIKPYPGESEDSFAKRKAYYIRITSLRLKYGRERLEEKLDKAKPISAQDREEIDALWARYLTPVQRDKLIDYKYYDVYNSLKREGEHLCDYMPDPFYCAFIDDYYENPQHSKPCDDKNLYDLYFYDIRRPETIFRKSFGLFLDGHYDEISLDRAITMAREHGEVILKICRFSGGGDGIKFWNSATEDESVIRDFLNGSNDIICQSLIKQHSELSRLNASSVNSVRIMTLMLHGKIRVLSSVLRMGTNESRLDNASSGGIMCGIKPNGQLKSFARDICANTYEKHPSGTAFESVVIPNFDECISMVTSLAKRFCSVSRMISWDLAIGEDGHPMLIEFNTTWGGLDVHQLSNGPIFGDLTQEVLDDVFQHAYTLNAILKSM